MSHKTARKTVMPLREETTSARRLTQTGLPSARSRRKSWSAVRRSRAASSSSCSRAGQSAGSTRAEKRLPRCSSRTFWLLPLSWHSWRLQALQRRPSRLSSSEAQGSASGRDGSPWADSADP